MKEMWCGTRIIPVNLFYSQYIGLSPLFLLLLLFVCLNYNEASAIGVVTTHCVEVRYTKKANCHGEFYRFFFIAQYTILIFYV